MRRLLSILDFGFEDKASRRLLHLNQFFQNTRARALYLGLAVALIFHVGIAADFTPGAQKFHQEIARSFGESDGLPRDRVQLLEISTGGNALVFAGGRWLEFQNGRWQPNDSLTPSGDRQFAFQDLRGQRSDVPVPWREVRQVVRSGATNFISAGELFAAVGGKLTSLNWDRAMAVNQIAVSPEGALHVASSGGLFEQREQRWQRLQALDSAGRDWSAKDILAVGFDSTGQRWFGSKAGVGCRTPNGWKFYEGKDGLPWADFTFITPAADGQVWFCTRLGAIKFDGKDWHYRQGRLWLPDDEVSQIAVDAAGTAWFVTAAGVGSIERWPMTLAEKAEHYEQEIEHYIKRTPFGYVAEANLRKPADKSSADPQDSDNDGLWTAMYGAGECFAYAATKDAKAKDRARKAFEALRFLQKVTQGCEHAPPKGYIARTIRPIDWPDPNRGRLERDREEQKRDRLWKVYEPRWPKSADGKWYWKSDTSSDELDGHFFFYPLYYDLCAETETERERVREVVRDVTDHLITHGFTLVDHDGKPTRWAIYGPQYLNHDLRWWPERGLNSLSILTYLAAAAHVTGDSKYAAASRELIERHSYAHNIMYPKMQHGPGSGNQSDDEMAFMCYYGLLRCSQDEELKGMVRLSFFSYWINEEPEMNPFFNFAYVGQNLEATGNRPFGRFSLRPSHGWQEDSMATLYGFPLDRLNWSHQNSHRLDVVDLPPMRSLDLDERNRRRSRGHLVNGKVLPVENRFFNHWNTDPWQLDYGGHGNELAAGTVYLLPYYMGLYHGFIELPRAGQ